MGFSWDSLHMRYLRAVLIVLLVLYVLFFEPFNLEVTENTFDLFGGSGVVKIVLIGDTQDAYNHPQYFQRAIATANAQKPDIILIAGDVVEVTDDWDKISLLGNLESRYGTFAVLGNHDYVSFDCEKCTDKLVSNLESMDITVLRNENRVLEINNQEFALIGVDDLWAGQSSYENASFGISPKMPKVILVHNQNSMKNQKLEGRNLILSGHTHCGLIQIPFLTDLFLRWNGFADVVGGHATVDENTELYVTCGVTPGGARFFTRPEVSVIYLE